MVQTPNPEKDPNTGRLLKYAMIAQDSYSRYTFAVPLEKNTSAHIQMALDEIFATGYKPQSIVVSLIAGD